MKYVIIIALLFLNVCTSIFSAAGGGGASGGDEKKPSSLSSSSSGQSLFVDKISEMRRLELEVRRFDRRNPFTREQILTLLRLMQTLRSVAHDTALPDNIRAEAFASISYHYDDTFVAQNTQGWYEKSYVRAVEYGIISTVEEAKREYVTACRNSVVLYARAKNYANAVAGIEAYRLTLFMHDVFERNETDFLNMARNIYKAAIEDAVQKSKFDLARRYLASAKHKEFLNQPEDVSFITRIEASIGLVSAEDIEFDGEELSDNDDIDEEAKGAESEDDSEDEEREVQPAGTKRGRDKDTDSRERGRRRRDQSDSDTE